jgi:methylmalonyl-CoA mutase N-terminal domain/subunit
VDAGEAVVVGVNRYVTATESTEKTSIEVFQINPDLEAQQVRRVQQVRQARDQARWQAALGAVRDAASGTANLVPSIITAVEAHATVGEIADTLRGVFGEYREVSLD